MEFMMFKSIDVIIGIIANICPATLQHFNNATFRPLETLVFEKYSVMYWIILKFCNGFTPASKHLSELNNKKLS